MWKLVPWPSPSPPIPRRSKIHLLLLWQNFANNNPVCMAIPPPDFFLINCFVRGPVVIQPGAHCFTNFCNFQFTDIRGLKPKIFFHFFFLLWSKISPLIFLQYLQSNLHLCILPNITSSNHAFRLCLSILHSSLPSSLKVPPVFSLIIRNCFLLIWLRSALLHL